VKEEREKRDTVNHPPCCKTLPKAVRGTMKGYPKEYVASVVQIYLKEEAI
jgi:hypothetical protein